MNDVKFQSGSVPVAVAARVYDKGAEWVRAGIVAGWLPIGRADQEGQTGDVHQGDELEVRQDQLLHLSQTPL